MNFKKAFDSVNREILLRKLHHYGLRGFVHDWLRFYLENRTQYVQVGKSYFNDCNLSHGVPRGSILGPLLFIVQINDLPTPLEHSNLISLLTTALFLTDFLVQVPALL